MRGGGPASGRAPPHILNLVPLLTVASVLFCSPFSAAAEAEPSKLVVVFYPHESDGAPGIIQINRAIRSTFATQPPGQIAIRNEYVDASRLHDAAFMQAKVALLQRKYDGRKVDLVIAVLSSGLDFALAVRGEVFPGVPIVFVLVDHREVKARRLPRDVIGVPIHMDLTRTLDLALRLHPETRRVFVIAGSSAFDAKWEAEARRAFRPYGDRLEFVYLTGVPMGELLERVADLPAQSIVYYLHIFKDGTGKDFVPAEAVERLAARANAPIYSHADTFVDRGALGGHVYIHETEGMGAARLGLRILSGERPEAIPVPASSANTYLFNWRQLHRWGIDEESLPPGSVVRHREPSGWGQYKWHILGAVALILVQGALIGGLLVQRVKWRRSDERFQQVVETAPTGMLLVGRDGAIVLANAQVEKLFGYQKAELIGQPVELLLPEHGGFFAAPDVRLVGLGRGLFGLRKDGREFPVEIGLSPLRTPRGVFVLASIVDLTARKQAEEEFRESQQELRFLTGRLLEAQEAERRRIARELHDDLNQSLALLAVEMDTLGRKPPASAGEFAERMMEISARVKELSTAVHDLSHELHPSKLEHLGLVPAVGGLCKDMALGHGLEVEFTHFPEPGVIPPDTALCLYRIVQEALRNVVKHSESRYASVELSGTADEVRLCVVDDGVGFEPGRVAGDGGLGLVGMRERLLLVGGGIAIDSKPGGGTRIEVRVPVPSPIRTADLASV